jgi:protein involved in polysaccharide export with SLBB domain
MNAPRIRTCLTACILVLSAACASTSNDYLRLQASAYADTISPGDEITVTDRMTGNAVFALARVSPDGTVELPAIGPVQVAGLSAERLRRELGRQYADLDIPTQLHVERNSPLASFTVIGEVRREGRFALEPGTTVSQAVAMADPDPDYADLFQVRIVRGEGENERSRNIDLRLIEMGNRAHDMVLRDGDILFVPVTAFGRAVSPVRTERTGLSSSNPNLVENDIPAER